MRKFDWSHALKQLPRIGVFSFGIALSIIMMSAIGSVALSSSGHDFGPSEARLIFTVSFVTSFIFLFLRNLLREKVSRK